ncbi:hypothetical protein [Paraliomyxa miuraensis]|uniref:hypothetical protein n=1 Tax=Paraliomyxa miuraensis TaxID=376150 RepID=UPI0022545357|nr:hypothetical protein [Paraliomyxa miuraensis]MCX4239387.1 hypothetical protein [Paraliomyxa miuraensis]
MTSELDTLRPILEAIAPDDIINPITPIAVALQEASDLHAAIKGDDTWERLVEVGVDPAAIDAIPLAVAATRQAQSQWVVARDRGKAEAQREREQSGIELRADIVAACRWNLRNEAAALRVVDEIVQGEGIADLVQDLVNLAALLGKHPSAFDGDDTFDAPEQAEAARSVAEEITAGLAESRTTGDHEAAKVLRDRAYTHLAKRVADLREAGRYAFRKEPRRAAVFGSAYMRRAKARSRRRAAEVGHGSEPEAAVA